MNVMCHLQQQVAARLHAPALIDARARRARPITYAELDARITAVARTLQHAGLHAGDRVVVLVPLSPELYIVLGALFRSGMTAVILDPAQPGKRLQQCCEQVNPVGFIGTARAHALRLLVPALRAVRHAFSSDLPVPGACTLPQHGSLAGGTIANVDPDAPALLSFTSGSTGTPKPIARSHAFLLAQHHAVVANFALAADAIEATTMPVFVLANLGAGVTTLIPPGRLAQPGAVAPAPFVAALHQHAATRLLASPALLDRLADYCLQRGQTLDTLSTIHTGGAPVFPPLLHKLAQVAPRAQCIAVYGSSEAEPIACLPMGDITQTDWQMMEHGAGVLAGSPTPDTVVRIVPDRHGVPMGSYSAAEFAALCLLPGTTGEIVVSGAHVLVGYLAAVANHTSRITVEGVSWYRTGDAGCLDRSGRLWLMGRCSARIDDMHGRLYPLGVECAAMHVPGVRRAALVGHRGRRVLLLEGQPAQFLPHIGTLRGRLTWAHIDEIIPCKSLPVDTRHNAKIDYPRLRQLVRRRVDRV